MSAPIETLLSPDIKEHVVEPILHDIGLDFEGYKLFVNPTGRFEIGGPQADTGLTGRKIIVDTYGGMARHGGGAFSGKDPTKVDRSAAYAVGARRPGYLPLVQMDHRVLTIRPSRPARRRVRLRSPPAACDRPG